MYLKSIIFKILFLSVFVMTSCKSEKTANKTTDINKKPNIVVIYLDDLGYGDLGTYGANRNTNSNYLQLLKLNELF